MSAERVIDFDRSGLEPSRQEKTELPFKPQRGKPPQRVTVAPEDKLLVSARRQLRCYLLASVAWTTCGLKTSAYEADWWPGSDPGSGAAEVCSVRPSREDRRLKQLRRCRRCRRLLGRFHLNVSQRNAASVENVAALER